MTKKWSSTRSGDGTKREASKARRRKQKQEDRMPGIDPKTGEYSTAQMMIDEMTMGDTSQPLFD